MGDPGGQPIRASILSIGNELTTGAIVDTNAAWLTSCLIGEGVEVVRHVTVGDDREVIAASISEMAGQSDLVIVTGGIGPTPDDLTRDALAIAMGKPLIFDGPSFASISAFFARINRPMPESNRRQAMLPTGALALENNWGTAPGIQATVKRATVFILPGVPREMRAFYEAYINPHLETQPARSSVALRVLHTFGAGESDLGERMADLMPPDRNPSVGTTAVEGVISIRIQSRHDNSVEAQRIADRDAQTVRERLGVLVFGEGDDTLASVVGSLLADRKLTIATAESCTGGLIGKLLTDVFGSSSYYLGGFITYSNEQKSAALQVDPELIEKEGAVSESVVRAMARGCRAAVGSDFALATTGIAGPTGGTPDKPVGLVHIALAGSDRTVARKCVFHEGLGREAIRDRAAKSALNMLRLELLGKLK